ncbi:hypothetical protein Smic_14490 [Streptomyces microflavus]|uniref:Uncharacterized protein n=2 Tax=Streptomyces TaxID=1883 RepID=A0A7J0CK96_STRMI|nr:hypothetical protein Smic_14490 [Streptomyces microflavus]
MSTPPLTLARAGLSAEDLVGLYEPQETRTRMWERDGVETDLDGGSVARGIEELHRVLDEAQERSRLPEAATALQDLHDLVVRARLAP